MQVKSVNNQINYNTSSTINNAHKVKADVEEKGSRINEMKKVGKEPEYNKEFREYTEEEIISAIEDANEEFVAYDRKFEFSIHEKTKQITIKVLDSLTDEIIREVPPEKILDTIAGIWEIAGILVDERV